jgi:hypothetical protein
MSTSEHPTPTVSELMETCATDAKRVAHEKFQIDLDGSFESIEQLERILSIQWNALPRGWKRFLKRGPTDEEIQRLTFLWGGYLGEAMRARLGGEWTMPDEGLMAGYACLNIDGMLTSPQAKVGKRLTNGPEDNVWFYAGAIEAHLKGHGETAGTDTP